MKSWRPVGFHRWFDSFAIGLLLIFLLAAFLWPRTFSKRGGAVKASSNIRQIFLALSFYEKEHGHLPAVLSDLETSVEKISKVLVVENEDGKKGQILYLVPMEESSNFQLSDLSPETVILKAPFAIGGKQVVGYADGRVKISK